MRLPDAWRAGIIVYGSLKRRKGCGYPRSRFSLPHCWNYHQHRLQILRPLATAADSRCRFTVSARWLVSLHVGSHLMSRFPRRSRAASSLLHLFQCHLGLVRQRQQRQLTACSLIQHGRHTRQSQ